jgi:16S rRNA processing protein RimM
MKITKDECYYLGYISKNQGFEGRLIAFFDVDDPREYLDLDFFLIDLNGVLSPFYIETLKLKPNDFIQLTLEGIDSELHADELTGKELYLPLSFLPELPDDQYYLHELPGMQVEDEELGPLGQVDKVLEYTKNPLLQIWRDGTEVLIPIIPDFIIKVEKDKKIIRVNLPEGLVEVNQK